MAGFAAFTIFWILAVVSAIQPTDVMEAQTKGLVSIVPLAQSREAPLQAEPKKENVLDIYCYSGKPGNIWKKLPRLFRSATLYLNIRTEAYETYRGDNESVVYQQYVENLHRWINLVPWQQKSVSLNIFNKTCVGIKTHSPYSVSFKIKEVDFTLVGLLLLGLFLFIVAGALSRNILFYYGTGVSVGVFASVLIVVFILSRFVPWKKGSYLVLLGGGSISLWFLQYVWENCQKLLTDYWEYVLGYVLVAGLLSFAVCYWFGPVENPRSLDLIKWTIQLFASVLMFMSTQIPEVSVAIIVLVVCSYQLSALGLPCSVPRSVRRAWRRRFPKKHVFLSEDEYHRQGEEETRRALEELRKHVRSPDCNAWKTISRLGSPRRFASWVEGDSHLTEDELTAFERSVDFDAAGDAVAITDDEDEIDFRLSSS